MMEHTKENWVVSDHIYGSDGKRVASHHVLSRDESENEANARRIVACVNACYGIATDQLEQVSNNPTPVFELLLQTTNERDSLNKLCEFNERTMTELVNTLDSVLEELDKAAKYHASHECYAEAKRVEAYIASIKGESA